MEEVMNALRKIQRELDDQKSTILKNGERVTEQVTQNINSILDEKFKIWEEKYDNLKIKLENQEKRLYFLEKQARQRNIVFFGVEETETSYSNLESNITNFVSRYFSIELDRRDIQEIKRIGKKGEKPRPTIVTFSTLGIKIDIFKQKKRLKDTPFYIKEDYPQYVLEKRRLLQEQVEIERNKGNLAVIKYDKLIIIAKNTNSSGINKRILSASPENIRPQDDQKSQKGKKIKTHTSLQRSSSLSEGVLKPGMLNFLTTKNPTHASSKQNSKNMNIL